MERRASEAVAAPPESWRRIVYVAFTAQLLALWGFNSALPFLPLYLVHLGLSEDHLALWSGILQFAEEIPTALVAILWGVVGDRFGRKLMVVRAMVAGAFVVALLAVATNVWTVLGLMIASGVLTGIVAPTAALVASAVPPASLAWSMGMMQTAVFVAGGAGPFFGGFVYDRGGFVAAFATGSAMLAVAALLVIFFVPERFERRRADARTAYAGILHEAADVVHIPGLVPIALLGGGIYFAAIFIYPILPLLVRNLNGVPQSGGVPLVATMVGIILGVAGVCSTTASLRAHRAATRIGYRRTIVGSMIIAAAAYATIGVATSVWHLLAARAIVSICVGATLPLLAALVGFVAPEAQRAAAYGLTTAVQSIAIATGMLAGGATGAAIGLRATFVVAAVVFGIVGLASLALVRHDPARPRHGGEVEG